MGKIRVGVIGIGVMGKHHARIYNELDESRLVAVADVDQDVRAEFQERYPRVVVNEDYLAMLKYNALDAVSICTPTNTHRKIFHDVVDAGLHAIIEKPLAHSWVACQSMIIKAGEKPGMTYAVGHTERFNPAVRELKNLIVDDTVGDIFQMSAVRKGPWPRRYIDTGAAMDLAVHDVDVMNYLNDFADIERCYGYAMYPEDSEREAAFGGMLHYENTVVGTLEASWCYPIKVREITVTGKYGALKADYLTQDIYLYEHERTPHKWDALELLRGAYDSRVTKYSIWKEEPLRRELQGFIDRIRGSTHTDDIVSLEEGAMAVRFVDDMLTSASAGIRSQAR
jgi:UDP-N-acetylglucosamine 3-dehydrogenase